MRQIDVTWVEPVPTTVPLPITSYTATAYLASTHAAVAGATCTAAVGHTSCSITSNLVNGTAYEVRVTSASLTPPRTSLPTDAVLVTTTTVPGNAQVVSLVAGHDTANVPDIRVQWNAPSTGGLPISGYRVTTYRCPGIFILGACLGGGGFSATAPGGAPLPTCVIAAPAPNGPFACTLKGGLTFGTRYWVWVTATNLAGNSPGFTILPSQNGPVTPLATGPVLLLAPRTAAKGTLTVAWSKSLKPAAAAKARWTVRVYPSATSNRVLKTCISTGAVARCASRSGLRPHLLRVGHPDRCEVARHQEGTSREGTCAMSTDRAGEPRTDVRRATPTDQGATVNDENDTERDQLLAHLASQRPARRRSWAPPASASSASPRPAAPGAIAAGGTGFTPTRSDEVHLVATDGWVSMPESAAPVQGFWPDTLAPDPYNMYVFGFRDVTGMNDSQVIAQRGLAQISAPVLGFDEGSEVKITLTNLGLSMRPDLVDGHTLHWHGFNNAIPIFDGVPEMSASVPIGKSITYYYRPHEAGTYMYHCHFEDVEHVQMGMTGLLYVRPKLNSGDNTYVFNDPTTKYDRWFPLFLTREPARGPLARRAHPGERLVDLRRGLRAVQRPRLPRHDRAVAAELRPGPRAQRDPGNQLDGTTSLERLRYQPRTALMEAVEGETVLLRIAHLGSVRHTITLDGIPMHVIGSDASQLQGRPAARTPATSPTRSASGRASRATCCSPHRRPAPTSSTTATS